MEAVTMPENVRQATGDLKPSCFDLAAMKAETINCSVGALTGYDCPVCNNRGYVAKVRDGAVVTVPCGCMEARASIRRAAESGLQELLRDYTLETYETPEPWQKAAKETAERYLEAQHGWLVASGTVGSGKSHLCVAVCGELLRRGKAVRYLMWRDQIARLKPVGDMEERGRMLAAYKAAEVLYIDDFFKSGRNEMPSRADVDVALELIMARYNQRDKLTILSTERSIDELLDIDEALGSRVYERSKGFYLRFAGREKNWRLR